MVLSWSMEVLVHLAGNQAGKLRIPRKRDQRRGEAKQLENACAARMIERSSCRFVSICDCWKPASAQNVVHVSDVRLLIGHFV